MGFFTGGDAGALVVGDGSTDRDRAVAAFTASGFTVDVAGDPLAVVEAYRPDRHAVVVVVESEVAGGRGLEVCRALRRRSDVAIIVITSSADEEAAVAAFDAGADDCLAKPFRARELVSRARSAVRRAPLPGTERVIEIGDVRLDPSAFRVELRGDRLELTRLEFALLRLLMANAGRVVSRRLIAEEVWGSGAAPPKTLETHVRHLRLKLQDDPAAPRRIVTVRSAGYRYEQPPG